jgi:hypothetical protein
VKSSEQQLREWTLGEVTFDSGGAQIVFTNEEFSALAYALSTGSFDAIQHILKLSDQGMHVWRMSYNSFGARPYPTISAQWLLKFSSVLEVMFVLMNLHAVNLETI